MSAACSPTEVTALCRDLYQMDRREVDRMLSLCHSLDAGWDDGQRYSVPGEPPRGWDDKPGTVTAPPPEKLVPPVEEIAAKAGRRLWRSGVARALTDALDYGRELWSLEGLLAECGLDILDVCPLPALRRAAWAIVPGRPLETLPAYFEDVLSHRAGEILIRCLHSSDALAEARQPFTKGHRVAAEDEPAAGARVLAFPGRGVAA